MLKGFKDYLIPHEGNDHKPHLFREASVLLVLFVAVFLFATSLGSTFVIRHTNLLGNVQSAVLVDLTNRDRIGNGEGTLTVSPLLTQAAELKAADMASKGYFAHTSPEGLTPWYWFDQVKYPFTYAGENLAIDFRESESVERAWIASPTHRANIMNDHFTEIGIATKTGMYQGHETTYVVQMFGKPKKPKTIPVKTITPKETTSNTSLASAITTQPEVKGESTENLTPVQYQILQEDTSNMVVQDITPEEDDASRVDEPVVENEYQTTFMQRLFVNQPHIVDYAYKLIMAFLLVGLIFFIAHEVRLEHRKHILYGILLLVILISLTYLNHVFMLTDKVLI